MHGVLTRRWARDSDFYCKPEPKIPPRLALLPYTKHTHLYIYTTTPGDTFMILSTFFHFPNMPPTKECLNAFNPSLRPEDPIPGYYIDKHFLDINPIILGIIINILIITLHYAMNEWNRTNDSDIWGKLIKITVSPIIISIPFGLILATIPLCYTSGRMGIIQIYLVTVLFIYILPRIMHKGKYRFSLSSAIEPILAIVPANIITIFL